MEYSTQLKNNIVFCSFHLYRNLKLEYIDLYLLHWPVSVKPGEYELPVKKKELLPIDIKSVWEAMEECQKLGLAKSIGVSNFSCKKLETLLATAKIPPAVNQVSNFFLAKMQTSISSVFQQNSFQSSVSSCYMF